MVRIELTASWPQTRRPTAGLHTDWWRRVDLNHHASACKAAALPLSYAPIERLGFSRMSSTHHLLDTGLA